MALPNPNSSPGSLPVGTTADGDLPFYQRWWNSSSQWFNTNVGSGLGSITTSTAKTVEDLTKDNLKITAAQVKDAMPFVAAAGVGVTSMLMWPTVEKVGKSVGGFAKKLVTGFGYFEKIPVLGSVFTGAGWLVDKISDYGGILVAGTSSFLAYHLFQPAISRPQGNPANMPDAGTGARPQEPIRANFDMYAPGTNNRLGRENGPVRPQDVPVSDGARELLVQQPELAEAEYSRLRELRAQSLGQDTPEGRARSELLRALMSDENQRYENRRLFLGRVNEFATSIPDGGNRSQRGNMIVILAGDNVGLTQAEAEYLVPPPPNLRSTVTPGTSATTNSVGSNGQSTDFGGGFSQLVTFAQSAENYYGKGFFTVSTRNANGNGTTQERLAFNDMSVTQQHEFIQKALEHCRTNLAWFNARTRQVTRVRIRPLTDTVTTWVDTVYDYDRNATTEYLDENGARRSRTFSSEHDFLGTLNGNGRRVETVNLGLGDSINYNVGTNGNGLATTTSDFGNWQRLLDMHRQALSQAETSYNGEIRRYVNRVRLMQQSLQMIQQHSIAPLRYGSYEERAEATAENHNMRHYVQVRDLRNATAGNRDDSQLMRLEGEWVEAGSQTNWNFVVRAISTGPDGERRIPLANPITVNFDTGEGMELLKPEMTRIRQVRQAAQAAFTQAGVRVVSNVENRSHNYITIEDTRVPGQTVRHTFMGTLENGRFVATGLAATGLGDDAFAPLTQPEIVVDNIENPANWVALLNVNQSSIFNRFTVGPVLDIPANAPARPFAGANRTELRDSTLSYNGKIIVYGTHNADNSFTVTGYELRSNNRREGEAGRFVTKSATLNFDTRAGFDDLFREIRTEAARPESTASLTNPPAGINGDVQSQVASLGQNMTLSATNVVSAPTSSQITPARPDEPNRSNPFQPSNNGGMNA